MQLFFKDDVLLLVSTFPERYRSLPSGFPRYLSFSREVHHPPLPPNRSSSITISVTRNRIIFILETEQKILLHAS